MTQSEAINLIISKPKFYAGIMPQSTASGFVTRYKAGIVKQKTIEEFLKKFGFEKVEEAKYCKR